MNQQNETPRQSAAQRATEPEGEARPAQTSDSAGTLTRHYDAAKSIVTPPSVRDVMRQTALENELRVMASMTIGTMRRSLTEALERTEVKLSESALERMQRDGRFRLPRTQVRRLLEEFCSPSDPSKKVMRNTLVVVAHQDDETIGVGGQLTRLENATIVHVTNGAPRDAAYAQRFGFSHPDDYAAARQREARDALHLAGVKDEQIVCLGIEDGTVEHHTVELAYSLAELIEGLAPEIIVTHPYEGGHTDHDAISLAVQLACGVVRREGIAVPAVLELTSYHNREGQRVVLDFLPFGPRDDVHTVSLTPKARRVKAKMFDCFETQQECLSHFSTDLERFRPAPRYNYTEPPHPGVLDYERLCSRLSGAAWRARAQRALEQVRSGSRTAVPVGGIVAPVTAEALSHTAA